MSHDTELLNSAKVSKISERTDLAVLAALRARPEFAELTRSQVQRMLKEGWVYDRGKQLLAKSLVDECSELEVRRPPKAEIAESVRTEPLEILFEDAELVVINKPIGLVVHGDAHHTDHVSARLSQQIGPLSRLFEDRPGVVHRLDKDTSGALVVAKTDRAHVGLAELFAKHDLRREYRAWVYGVPQQPKWKVDNRLMRDPSDRKRFIVAKEKRVVGGPVGGNDTSEEGRRAISHFELAKVYEYGLSELRVRLETGRTHQVRVHAMCSGHSVVGDRVYGVPTSRQNKWISLPVPIQAAIEALPGQALHAEVLEFKHPVTGELVSARAPLPEHLQKLLLMLTF